MTAAAPAARRRRAGAILLEVAVAIFLIVTISAATFAGVLTAIGQASEVTMDALAQSWLANEAARVRNSLRPGLPGSWLSAQGYPETPGQATSAGPFDLNPGSAGPVYRADGARREMAAITRGQTDYHAYTITVTYTQRLLGRARTASRSLTVEREFAR